METLALDRFKELSAECGHSAGYVLVAEALMKLVAELEKLNADAIAVTD